MKVILEMCKTNHDFAVFLKSPVVKTDKKQAVLKQIFSGKLNKVSEDFVQLIASHKREMYLVEIATEFINQYKEKKKILTAVVTTANGIDEATRKKIMELVKGSGSGEVVLEEKIDKSIIGGVIIRIGDKQIDASISRKLSELKQTFKENPFIREF
jgi:F-type H+-transporting ATPase subunit delta